MKRREAIWLAVAALAALGPRIAFAWAIPTIPISDFSNLVNFAVFVRDHGLEPTPAYQFFGIGLPFALALVLEVVPGRPPEVARYATAVISGLAALAPFVIWRGVFGLRTRLGATLLLSLWPGHVVFSTAVAQDNWVLLPSLALGALAVRALATRDEGHPLTSALLFVFAVAIRQDMLVAMVPLALPAAGAFCVGPRRRRWLSVWAVTALAGLLAVAGVRFVASGRYSLGTEHAGLAVLGAATPGAGTAYWAFPQTYFAAYEPHLVGDWYAMRDRSMVLGLRELGRRPLYHAIRMFSAGVNCLARSDVGSSYWTISTDVLPPSHDARGERLAARLRVVLEAGPLVALGLFSCGLMLARRPPAPLLALAAAMALKVLLHTVIAAQPRYFVVVTALALLGAAASVELGGATRARGAASLAAGMLLVVVLFKVGDAAEAYVLAHEEQLTYRFVLGDETRGPQLECTMAQGLLTAITTRKIAEVSIRTLRADPLPGEQAVVECRVNGRSGGAAALQVKDTYAGSAMPDRVLQSVVVDGQEVLRHDVAAEPGTGWATVPLSPEARWVVVRVSAVKPDPGGGWGWAATTLLRVVRVDGDAAAPAAR